MQNHYQENLNILNIYIYIYIYLCVFSDDDNVTILHSMVSDTLFNSKPIYF